MLLLLTSTRFCGKFGTIFFLYSLPAEYDLRCLLRAVDGYSLLVDFCGCDKGMN